MTTENLVSQLELHLMQALGAVSVLVNPHKPFIEQLNELLSRRGFDQIKVSIAPTTVLGCECAVGLKNLQKMAELAYKYVAQTGECYGVNGMLAVYEFAAYIYNYFRKPVKYVINQLIKEEIEHQILNASKFSSKRKMFSFLLYMLSGCVFYFREAEFYCNLVSLLEEFYKVLDRVLVRDKSLYQKQKKGGHDGIKIVKQGAGGFRGCTARRYSYVKPEFEVDVGRKEVDAKEFYGLVGLFSCYLSDYVSDKFYTVISHSFDIYDADLSQFLRQMGGIDYIYSTILRIYLQYKSIFKKQSVNYMFEGIQYLIKEVQALNPNVAPLVRVIKDDIFYMKIKDGVLGVEQLLELVGKYINVYLIGGIFVDEVINYSPSEVEHQLEIERKLYGEDGVYKQDLSLSESMLKHPEEEVENEALGDYLF